MIWALPISLATTFGIDIFFLFLRVIRCFSSPGSLHIPIDSVYDTMTLLIVSSLIRISADRGLFAAPRSFSQLVTSFFGAMYLGIHLYALCSLIFILNNVSVTPSNFTLLFLDYTRLLFSVFSSYAFLIAFLRINLNSKKILISLSLFFALCLNVLFIKVLLCSC